MSKVTEDLGYKVDEVESTRIEAEKIDETFKSGFIGGFTPPFFHFRLYDNVIFITTMPLLLIHYPFELCRLPKAIA